MVVDVQFKNTPLEERFEERYSHLRRILQKAKHLPEINYGKEQITHSHSEMRTYSPPQEIGLITFRDRLVVPCHIFGIYEQTGKMFLIYTPNGLYPVGKNTLFFRVKDANFTKIQDYEVIKTLTNH